MIWTLRESIIYNGENIIADGKHYEIEEFSDAVRRILDTLTKNKKLKAKILNELEI
jgi:hypothetical protein